jgi:dihydropteroate synthase
MFSPVLDCRGREVVLDTTRIVGIINVTADSFSDGGRFLDPAAAIEHGLGLAEEGADMLDVGAESTRPGAHPVSPEQQIARVVPVIEALVKRTSCGDFD